LLLTKSGLVKLLLIRILKRNINSVLTDEIIIRLVESLNGGEFEPETINPPFEYYKGERIKFDGKLYRLIWMLEKDQIYIGVVNAHRR